MLYYREAGDPDGRPLVLLHPGPGLDGSVFFPEIEALEGVRILAVDLPGNGGSEDGDIASWSLSTWAQAVRDLVDELRLRDYVLLGHSFGGFVALTSVVDAPRHAAALITSCTMASEATPPPGMSEDPIALLPAHRQAAVREGFELEERATTPEECERAWWLQMPLFAGSEEGLAKLRERWRHVTYRVEPHRSREWGELEALEALGRADAPPVLAIAGANDIDTPVSAAQQIAGAARDGRCVVIEGAGHFPWVEQPAAYVRALQDFIAPR